MQGQSAATTATTATTTTTATPATLTTQQQQATKQTTELWQASFQSLRKTNAVDASEVVIAAVAADVVVAVEWLCCCW